MVAHFGCTRLWLIRWHVAEKPRDNFDILVGIQYWDDREYFEKLEYRLLVQMASRAAAVGRHSPKSL